MYLTYGYRGNDSALGALFNGASSMFDVWHEIGLEESWPAYSGGFSSGLMRDQFALAGDAWRSIANFATTNGLPSDLHPGQGRLFDPDQPVDER